MINLTNLACRTTSSTTCDAITRIFLCIAPVSGLFFTRAPCQGPHQTQTENVDIEPGHDQRRPGELQSAQSPQQQRSAGHPHYRHQQRQRRHPPGFIAPQQRAPDTIADEGR